MDELEPEPVKVVLLGESGVGKTSIISQFTSNQFNPRVPTSVSAKFVSKIIDFPKYNKKIKFDIWDTVGQEKYRSLAKIFYKDAKIIIFVYDITREFSFEALKDFWYKETQNNADNDPILALVGNKIDLYEQQKVDNNDGKMFADEIKAIFQTTSALSNSGIKNLFDNLGKKLINPDFDYKLGDQQAKENYDKKQNENKKGILIRKKEDKGIKIEDKDNSEEGKNEGKKKCC
jgi:small GTP-binding protein